MQGHCIVPVYRAFTIVGAVLTRNLYGDLEHLMVVDTTCPEELDVIYDWRAAAVASTPAAVPHSKRA